MGDELIDVLVVVPFDVLGEEPHLRHILEGKVGVYVVFIPWLDGVVVIAFLEEFIHVVELDRRFVAPCRELGVQEVRAGDAFPHIFETVKREVGVLEVGRDGDVCFEDVGDGEDGVALEGVSCGLWVLASLRFSGDGVGDARSCVDQLLEGLTRQGEVENLVDHRLGRRSFTLNFLSLQVLEGVLRSLRWNSLRWIVNSWCCHTSGQG